MLREKSGSRGVNQELGLNIPTPLYKIGNQQGPSVQYRNSLVFCANLYREKNLKKNVYMYIYVHIKLNLFAIHLKIVQHCKITIIHQMKKKKKAPWCSERFRNIPKAT